MERHRRDFFDDDDDPDNVRNIAAGFAYGVSVLGNAVAKAAQFIMGRHN